MSTEKDNITCPEYRTSEYRKWDDLKRRHGVTKEQYYVMLNNQNYLCPICGLPLGHDTYLNIAHTTRKIRGIVHSKCNRIISFSGANINILNNVINFLKNKDNE